MGSAVGFTQRPQADQMFNPSLTRDSSLIWQSRRACGVDPYGYSVSPVVGERAKAAIALHTPT
jgi:hypothetical protein